MLRRWKVQPGVGETILARIGGDIRTRREIGPSISTMQLVAMAHEHGAETLAAEHPSLNGSSPFDAELDLLPVRSNRSGQRQMEAAVSIHRLIAMARALEDRKYMGNDHNWRVYMEVLKSGAVEYKRMGGAGGGSKAKETRTLEAGEVVEGMSGTIGSIASAPHVGGELCMDFEGAPRILPVRKGIHITGLVSPETGDPNVNLQILERQ